MARLPLRKRRTKLDTVKDLAQIYTTLKLTQVGPRAARRAAKGYAGVKEAKAGGRGARRVVGIVLAPIAIGGLVAFLKKRNQEPPYQPVPSPMPEASEPRFETTPAMGEPGAPKSGTSSASPQEPADATADASAGASPEEPADATADTPAGDAAERS